VIRQLHYQHPVFSAAGVVAQANHAALIGHRDTSYCGAYWGNGFHEDGVASAERVCERLGVTRLAEAAWERGAEVTLITGPVTLAPPAGVTVLRIETTEEMESAVRGVLPASDVLIMAAAVADFAPAQPSPHKIKRETVAGDSFTIECTKNPDILKRLGERKARQVLVGFALETDDGPVNARGPTPVGSRCHAARHECAAA
jgi:hypothetical protein